MRAERSVGSFVVAALLLLAPWSGHADTRTILYTNDAAGGGAIHSFPGSIDQSPGAATGYIQLVARGTSISLTLDDFVGADGVTVPVSLVRYADGVRLFDGCMRLGEAKTFSGFAAGTRLMIGIHLGGYCQTFNTAGIATLVN